MFCEKTCRDIGTKSFWHYEDSVCERFASVGSVLTTPLSFGLINDAEHHVILFLDSRLKEAGALSFHPNDCRGTVVISQAAFQQYLASVGNKVEYIKTN